MKQKITELRTNRAGLVEQARSILDSVDTDKGLTAESRQELERMESEIENLNVTIRALESELFSNDNNNTNPAAAAVSGEERATAGPASEEYRDAWRALIASNGEDHEARAVLNTATDSEGGITAPDEFANVLLESLREYGTVRSLAQHLVTSTGNDIKYPKVLAYGAAAKRAENAAASEAEETFTDVTLKAYSYDRLAKISRELATDSKFDLVGYLAQWGAQAITLAQDPDFVSGDGTTEPEGIVTGFSVGKTAASTTEITFDELIDLQTSLARPYRKNAAFILGDTAEASLRKVKDANDNYIWTPSVQAGQPDVMLGKAVHVESNLADPAANAKTVVFGDLKRGYIVRDVGTITTEILREIFAVNRQIGVLVGLRSDGRVIDENAAVVLQQAAA